MNERYIVEFGAANSPDYAVGKKFHWTTMPVKIKYNPCQVTGCSTSLEAAVRKGIDFWKRNASLYGEIQTEYSDSGDIEVKYVQSTGGNTIGVCSASLGQYSNGAMVAIKPLSLDLRHSPVGASATRTMNLSPAHEMGRLLRAMGALAARRDLMYYLLTNKTSYSPRSEFDRAGCIRRRPDVGTYPASAAMADITDAGIAVQPHRSFGHDTHCGVHLRCATHRLCFGAGTLDALSRGRHCLCGKQTSSPHDCSALTADPGLK
ncbi:MAG: hypothetical protein U1F27_06360 [Turneriella sp.]